MPSIRSIAATTLLAVAQFASAQTWSDCNPMKQSGCPSKPGLTQDFSVDFTQGSAGLKDFTTTSGAVAFGSNGAEFKISKLGDGPTIQSNFYIFYGKVEVVMQAAPGAGIISSWLLQSDDLDEVDWEFVGSHNTEGQSNYFGKGNTTTYDRGQTHAISAPTSSFHTYALDWNKDTIVWAIDGAPVRTTTYASALGGKNYPQTPMNVRLGNWVAGDPKNNQGTIDWAGGLTDFGKGPFSMFVKSIKVTNYNPAASYSYGDMSGSSDSIELDRAVEKGKTTSSSASATSNSTTSQSTGAASSSSSSQSASASSLSSSSSSASSSASGSSSSASTKGLGSSSTSGTSSGSSSMPTSAQSSSNSTSTKSTQASQASSDILAPWSPTLAPYDEDSLKSTSQSSSPSPASTNAPLFVSSSPTSHDTMTNTTCTTTGTSTSSITTKAAVSSSPSDNAGVSATAIPTNVPSGDSEFKNGTTLPPKSGHGYGNHNGTRNNGTSHAGMNPHNGSEPCNDTLPMVTVTMTISSTVQSSSTVTVKSSTTSPAAASTTTPASGGDNFGLGVANGGSGAKLSSTTTAPVAQFTGAASSDRSNKAVVAAAGMGVVAAIMGLL